MALKAESPGARWSALWGLGMALMFVGERIIGSGSSGRVVALLLGLALAVAAMAVRARRARAATADRRVAETLLLRLYGLGLLAVVLYAVQSDLPSLRGGLPLESSWPRLATVLSALWPGVFIAAAWPVLLVELGYAQMAKAPRLETGRLKDAMYSGLGLAFATVFAFTAVYVSAERDKKLDLAYFRTARPGEVVRKIVRTLDGPLEIASFFPSGNEVREEVDNYLTDLAKESGQLKITHYDFDIDPIKAREYGVSTNGTLAFVRGKRHELLGVPVQFEAARNALKTLDKEVQQRLMLIVRQSRSAVFTVGHGERSWTPGTDNDKRAGVGKLRELLLDQSIDVREFGPSDGLAQDVPKETTAVFIMGPQRPFSAEESASVNRFMDRGGRLFVALDPENGITMKEVLDPLQLEYHAVTLANDQSFVPRRHQVSDRQNLYIATFSSHPSVTTVLRLGARAPVVLPGAGWIDAKRGRPIDIQVDAPLKAHYSTFEDKNGNFQADPGENRRPWEVSGATTKGLARAFAIADSDAFSDEALHVPGNQLLFLDVMHWLMGDEVYSGLVATEMDLPITHTRKQDVAWFYGTIFLAPALVVAGGWAGTMRRRRKKATSGGTGPTPPPTASAPPPSSPAAPTAGGAS